MARPCWMVSRPSRHPTPVSPWRMWRSSNPSTTGPSASAAMTGGYPGSRPRGEPVDMATSRPPDTPCGQDVMVSGYLTELCCERRSEDRREDPADGGEKCHDPDDRAHSGGEVGATARGGRVGGLWVSTAIVVADGVGGFLAVDKLVDTLLVRGRFRLRSGLRAGLGGGDR